MDNNKKVYIATFINALNYGAVLQAYALGNQIKSLGYDVQYLGGENDRIPACSSGIFKKIFFKLIAKRRIEKKINALGIFKEKYCDVTSDFDRQAILVCGSDQIWNVEITKSFNNCFFADGFTRALSYAVSCGDVKVLEKNKVFFKEKIGNFTALSTRETDLCDLITNLSGRTCDVVCDPTLLLNKDDYSKIDMGIKEKNYLLIYQMNNSSYLYDTAKYIAKKNALKIIEINNNMYNYRFHKHKTYYSCSPEDFLSLIKNAAFVVTNSFHGTVFSILYRKPFIVVKSGKRDSRIVELCERLCVENKMIDSSTELSSIDLCPINYNVVEKKIQSFAASSKQYLKDSLEKLEKKNV